MVLLNLLVLALALAAGWMLFRRLRPAAASLDSSKTGRVGGVDEKLLRAMQRGEEIDEWDDDSNDEDENGVAGDRRAGAPAATARQAEPQHQNAGGAVLRQRRAIRQQEAAHDEEEDAEAAAKRTAFLASLSKTERRKFEKQEEKDKRKQDVAAGVAEQRRRRQEAEDRDALAEENERQRELAEEAALSALREERKRKEDEGYQQWAGQIGLESKGELGEAVAADEALRKYLISEAPRKAKVHELETIAAKFGLSVEKVVACIEKSVAAKELSVVLDDRGKFIYVTDDEYLTIGRFLRQRGRVSMTELIREANRILTANEEATPVQ